jgi:hypothetical protein
MDIETYYQRILNEIEAQCRGFVRFSPDELDELNALLTPQNDQLEKVLCLVEHSMVLHLKFEKNLLALLGSPLPGSLLIFTLTCARRHIVEARFQRGQRLTFDFLEALKKLLHHKNPEVVEWTLRLIEGCGNQGIYFRQEFDKIKPPPWKWFNAHQRAVREIIALLERRWTPSEKS